MVHNKTITDDFVLLEQLKSLEDDTHIRVTFCNTQGFHNIIEGILCITEWDERFIRYRTEYEDSNEEELTYDLCTKHQVNPFLHKVELIDLDVSSLPIEFQLRRTTIEETIGKSISDLAWHNLKMGIEMDPLGLFEGLILSLLEGVEEVIADDNL